MKIYADPKKLNPMFPHFVQGSMLPNSIGLVIFGTSDSEWLAHDLHVYLARLIKWN